MDIFEASDFNFLLPRRARKVIAVCLLVGIAFVPSVQRWYLYQIQRHADHVTRDFVKQITPALPTPAVPEGH